MPLIYWFRICTHCFLADEIFGDTLHGGRSSDGGPGQGDVMVVVQPAVVPWWTSSPPPTTLRQPYPLQTTRAVSISRSQQVAPFDPRRHIETVAEAA